MLVKYPSLITIVHLSVILSSENGVHKKKQLINFTTQTVVQVVLLEKNHHPPVRRRGALYGLHTLSHKILQRHAFKDHDLLKSIICTASPRILPRNTS